VALVLLSALVILPSNAGQLGEAPAPEEHEWCKNSAAKVDEICRFYGEGPACDGAATTHKQLCSSAGGAVSMLEVGVSVDGLTSAQCVEKLKKATRHLKTENTLLKETIKAKSGTKSKGGTKAKAGSKSKSGSELKNGNKSKAGSKSKSSTSNRRRRRRRRPYPTKLVFTQNEARILSKETQNVMRGHGCDGRGWLDRSKSNYRKYTTKRIKKYVRNGEPNYGMTQIFRSSKGFCAVKYGWASVIPSPFTTVQLLVYTKVACSDDKIKFVSRRTYLRGWSMKTSKGKALTFGCFAFNKKSACEKIAKLKWKPFTADNLAQDPAGFSVQ